VILFFIPRKSTGVVKFVEYGEVKIQLKQSHYRPGQALRVPGG
jgi:hypothetical protein